MTEKQIKEKIIKFLNFSQSYKEIQKQLDILVMDYKKEINPNIDENKLKFEILKELTNNKRIIF